MKISLDPAGWAWATLVVAVVVVWCSWMIGWWIPSIWYLDQARHWPVAEGEVLRVSVEHKEDADDEWYYVLDFRIRYVVNGDGYTCEELRFGRDDVYDTEDAARLAWAKVALGGRADVFYDPTEPERAVVLPGAAPGELRLAAYLITLFVLVAFALPHLVGVFVSEAPSRDAKKARQHKESAYAGAGCGVLFVAGVILFLCWIFGLPWPATGFGAGVLTVMLTLLSVGPALYVFRYPDLRRR